ncbi:N-acetylmuramate alpha-1-phosphate uridylyltransferase MurU [Nitrincola sp.]|uniref:N-acetylmuramate alpha-1-phosphate uridylyltransferase MurU n=1 Tax=Nitrincola sp. TaxID=1926584 RepID=UPI003A92111E
MKAMILAAGLGTRMRPLTLHTPKPLLKVGGKALIVWHLERLAASGITQVVINHAWLGEQLEAELGNGQAWGLDISYSAETEPLETGGGILKALPQLITDADDRFLVINADVFCDLDLRLFIDTPLLEQDLGVLLMVDNPDWHVQGDFKLDARSYLQTEKGRSLTFSGISVLKGRLFDACQPGRFALAPLFRQAIANQRLRGVYHAGRWSDVGTPERLYQLDQQLGEELIE